MCCEVGRDSDCRLRIPPMHGTSVAAGGKFLVPKDGRNYDGKDDSYGLSHVEKSRFRFLQP